MTSEINKERAEYQKARKALTNYVEFNSGGDDEFDHESAACLNALLERLDGLMDVFTMSMTGHKSITDFIGEALDQINGSTWMHRWRAYPEVSPAPFDIVVTKTTSDHGDHYEIDWLEPYASGKKMSFGKNQNPQFWMPLETFNVVAPEWAQRLVEPAPKEALIERALREQASHGGPEVV